MYHVGLIFAAIINVSNGFGVSWDWRKWWTYDGISGPQFWGLINPDWAMCTHGRRQSPIDIVPNLLLYDPNLRPIHIDDNTVSGILNNTGHSIILTLLNKEIETFGNFDYFPSSKIEIDSNYPEVGGEKRRTALQNPVNLTGGPFSYKYQASHIHLHLGENDHEGSEHTINGTAFSAEIQLYGFNSELYSNFTQATEKSYGIVAVSVLIKVGTETHPGLKPILHAIKKIKWSDTWVWVPEISLKDLLPSTSFYVTYEGSLTQPPCHESVTWVIMNKPTYVSPHQMNLLREMRQGSDAYSKVRNNYRPIQELINRPLRTNIDFLKSEKCSNFPEKRLYKANLR